MKIIFRFICRLLGIVLLFIIGNLVYGIIKYGGVKNYSDILNSKDWQSSISEISILQPKSWISIFYEEETEQNIETPIQAPDTFQTVQNEPKEYSNNPYDPDYEDEFNSFFGTTTENKGEIKTVEKIENLGEVGFKQDEADEE